MAARRVAEHPAEAVNVLRGVIGSMHVIARSGDEASMALVDQDFHRRLCDLAGNAWLSRLYGQIADQMRVILQVNTAAHELTDFDELAVIHIPIVESLESGDPAVAERAVVDHLDEAERLFFAEASSLIEADGA